jgi:tryptophan synthase beta chain
MNTHVRFSPAEQQRLLEAELAGTFPDARGRFGPYGGRYVPETLIPALERLEAGMREHLHREDFQRATHRRAGATGVGRPTALSHAPRLSAAWGADIWFKREDLAHTGAHKINNALGQALCSRSGSGRAASSPRPAPGQHGVASAAACARLGLPCVVYMGAIDMERAGTERRADASARCRGGAGHRRRSNLARRHR